MWCNILKIKVSQTLDKNIHIQTKQVLKQNGENKHLNFLLKDHGNKNMPIIFDIKNKLKVQLLM